MSGILSEMDQITPSEACSILGLPHELIEGLSRGVFKPEPAGHLNLRQALGVDVLVTLCMLEPAVAVPIALRCAVEAQANGQRALKVWWQADLPQAEWIEACSVELERTAILIPAETMFTTLAARLVNYRAAMARPN